VSTAINTIEDLADIAKNLSGDYHLTRDLDFNDDASYENPANKVVYTTGDGWAPINTFAGSFDGAGFSISNLFIDRPATDYVGLFAGIGTASAPFAGTVRSLTLISPSVTGKGYVGALAGNVPLYVESIEDCHVQSGTITASERYSGGLIGRTAGTTTITGCSARNVSVTSTADVVGGLIGQNDKPLTRCSAINCIVSAAGSTGGLCGNGGSLAKIECLSSGCAITSTAGDVGGMAGGGGNWTRCAVLSASVIGSPGVQRAAIFVGNLTAGATNDCYAQGSVSAEGVTPAGFSFLVSNANIARSYVAGTGARIGGALAARSGFENDRAFGSATANFWNITLWNEPDSNTADPLTTAQAKSLATYTAAGWDIVAVAPGEVDTAYVWNIVEGESYPFHSWTLTSPVPPPPPPTPEPRGTEPQVWIEIDQDRCAEDCGVTCGGSTVGDEKCYNTWKTCQDRASYTDDTPLTLRFAIANSSLPRGTYVIPSVISKSTSPARANIGGRSSRDTGLGKRGAATISYHDHPHTDVLVDPYLSERSWDATERGTFWSKWLARNYHEGRPLRVLEGFAGQPLIDYTRRHYVIEHIDGPGSDGIVTIKALDILRLADDDKAAAPAASPGALRAGISDAVVPIQIVGGSEILYPAPGVVAIGEEAIAYTTSTDQSYGVQLTGVTRGAFGTTAAAHEEGSTAQWCLQYENERPEAIIYDLLTTYGNINPAFIDYPEWESESLTWDIVETVSRIIPRPEGVASLVAQVCEQSGCYIWWDDRAQQIRFRLLRPLASDEPIIPVTEQGHIVQGTASLVRRPQERASQVWISHRLHSPLAPLRNRDSYLRHRLHIDANAMSPREYDDDTRQEILGAWITDDAQAARLATRALQRIRDTPEYFTFTVPYKDRAIAIGDVIRVTFRSLVDSFGQLLSRLFLVISVDEVESGVKTRCEAVLYDFNERYAGFVEDADQGTGKAWADSNAAERAAFVEDVALSRYSYDTATDDERLRWVYWAKDVCAEVQGVAPCTSDPLLDPACENCWAFCSDRDNYDATVTSNFADGGKPYAWV